MHDYKIYKSDVIVDNHEEFVRICDHASKMLRREFRDATNTTWIYDRYNIFSNTAPNDLFYDLYKDLHKCIREYVGDDRKIWFQSWLNYLSYDEVENVLDMHGHGLDIHGYISIDPKKTITEFVNFEVENEVGNIYIGPTGDEYQHRVKNTGLWEGSRITLGFDCIFGADFHQSPNKFFPVL